MNAHPGPAAGETPGPVSGARSGLPTWPWSRRVRNAALPLFWAFYAAFFVSQTNLVAEHPALRIPALALAATYLVVALGELRLRVLLEHDGLVIVRFRHTRIPWADVSEVRVRGRSMGRGWVEVVRRSSREVVLPTPVEAYPVVKDQWERATAAPGPPGNAQRVAGA